MPVTTRSASRRMAAAQTITSSPPDATTAATTLGQSRIQSRRVNGKPGLLLCPPGGGIPTRRVVLMTGSSGRRLIRIRGSGERMLLRVPGKALDASKSQRRLSTFVRGGRVWIRILPAVEQVGAMVPEAKDHGQQLQSPNSHDGYKIKPKC